ncbi:pentatricopeptide repeat-containing protein [Tanacetum coccineum]
MQQYLLWNIQMARSDDQRPVTESSEWLCTGRSVGVGTGVTSGGGSEGGWGVGGGGGVMGDGVDGDGGRDEALVSSVVVENGQEIPAGDLEYGKQIYAHVCKNNLQSDEYIGSALIDMYSLWGLMTDSIRCFNSTKKQDIVIWTSAIVGHAQNGEYERELVIFCELLKNELKPDEFTVSTVLSACANLGGVRCGEQIQNYSVKSGIVKSSVVVNSLVYMYAKSGDSEALTLFDLMISMGIAPNDVAFLGVLTACSHGGLVEEGLRSYVATELPTKDSSLQFNMMALIFLEESDYSGVLLDLLSEKDNVAALLLEVKFVFYSFREKQQVVL